MKFNLFLIALLLGFTSVKVTADESAARLPVRVVIIGDSTVCIYPENSVRRGWGMFLQDYFDSNRLQVINLALSGRSTKTFIKEGHWAQALKEKPDYVLIQFGHNDSHTPDKPEATDAKTDYRQYLRQYIDETRTIGARPVLITPMCRRVFQADGTIKNDLVIYADAMKAVAAEKNVPLVDLNAASVELCNRLGQQASDALANEVKDQTHFNAKGAREMVRLVMQQLPVAEPSLKQYQKNPAAHLSVRDFGATGDGITPDTAAIQKALNAAATNGDGEVEVPAGHYLTGSLVLESHTTLHLDDGAVLQGSTQPDDYPIVVARWEGIETNCHRALISAVQAEDIAITGAGVIAGSPEMGRLRNPRGPCVMEMIDCGNVRIAGVTLKSSRMWTLHPTYCHDVQISGVTFDTVGGNSDGIDPDSCQRVTVDGCTFTTGDDNIAIKSGKGREGVKIGRPCEDIVITNCTFIKGYTSIALGSELSGGIRRVRISNCTFKQGRAALELKSRPGRGGFLEDITAEHLVVGPEPLLDVTGNYGSNPDSQGVPGLDGLTRFSGIRITDVKMDSKNLMNINGPVEKPADGIQISQVTGTCRQGSVIENARNVVLTGIQLDGISGASYFTNNVDGSGLDGSAPRQELPPATK